MRRRNGERREGERLEEKEGEEREDSMERIRAVGAEKETLRAAAAFDRKVRRFF